MTFSLTRSDQAFPAWVEFGGLLHDVERWIQDADSRHPRARTENRASRSPVVHPPLDVQETDTGYKVALDVPGVGANDVQLTLDGRSLQVTAKRSVGPDETVTYQRTLALPDGVEGDKVSASVAAGVLTLTLPKVEAVRPRVIAVAAG